MAPVGTTEEGPVARKDHYISVKPFFLDALAATFSVIFIPLAIVFGLMALLDPDPPIFLAAIVGVALAIAVMVIGNAMWSRRPEASDIGFSELMLWRWARRRHAEDELAHGARLLGLDRSGQPIDDVRISAEEQFQVLKDLTAALESKDPYTHGHSQRVERHAYRTAAAMGLSADDIEDLRKAAALHDVGKIRVPDRILRKAGPLTPEERTVVEEHSVVGAWMVSSVGNADVIAAVRHHHERWDGMGYPDGLAGTDVPLFARVIAVADAYDAITSTRPYRASSGRDEAVDALRDGAGSHFDPDVVETFIQSLPSRVPIAAGIFVMLGGPGRIAREIAMWFRRLGAGSLTPAAGATGAAIVLGASIFTPSVVDAGPSFQKGVAATQSAEDSDEVLDTDDDDVKGKVVDKDKKKKSDKGEKKSDDNNKSDRKSDGDRTDGAAVADQNSDNDRSGGTGGNAGSPGGGGQANEPNQPNEPNEPTQPPQPTPPPPSGEPTQDNPNDDRDGCGSDGDAGKGNDKDC